jgi:hypothetical protein
MSQSLLSKKLRGVVPWSVVELLLVANALGVDPGELLPKVDPEPVVDAPGALPRLDLNQQPFAYGTLQVSAFSADPPEMADLIPYPNVVPLHKIHRGERRAAKRRAAPHTYRPVILEFPNCVTG